MLVRCHLKSTNDSWRVDKMYVKVKGQWMYLYRAVDSKGNTIDFHLNKTRDHRAAKRFFKKALQSFHVSKPRVITVDKQNGLSYRDTAEIRVKIGHSITFISNQIFLFFIKLLHGPIPA